MSVTPLAAIPLLDLGRSFDQRQQDADVQYAAHSRLSEVFGRSVAVHRHDRLYQLHYLHSGAAHVYLDDLQYRVRGPLLIFTPPGIPHAFVTDADCEGHVLTVRQQLVWQLFEAGMHAACLDPRLARPLCVELGGLEGELAEEAASLELLLGLLRREAEQARAGRELNLQALVRLIFASVLRLAEQACADWPVPRDELQVFHRFTALIEARYREHWSLAQYAAALGVAEARLNRICRHLAAMSSKRLIFERLLQEAKRLLLHTGLGIGEIAYGLGFKDPGYFTRFFTRQLGVTPSDYRARGSRTG